MDPYVFVEIHGIPVDCMERRTRTVTHSSHNPVFDESFEFQITLPELAMVRFVVLDDHFIGDEFIGERGGVRPGGVGGASCSPTPSPANLPPFRGPLQDSTPSPWSACSRATGRWRCSP